MPRIQKSEPKHRYISTPKPKEWGSKKDTAFYNSKQWRVVREQVISNEPLCRYCMHFDNRPVIATVVDHIKRIHDGGDKFDANNLQPLCTSCHNTKSAYEGKGKIDPKTYAMYYEKK